MAPPWSVAVAYGRRARRLPSGASAGRRAGLTWPRPPRCRAARASGAPMPFVLPFPDIDPVLVSIQLFGIELAIRWYALAYIAGLLLGWRYVAALCARPALWGGTRADARREQADDLLTWMILGVILGGRLGFVLFYQPAYFAANPGRDPRGLAGRHVVPRRLSRRGRRRRSASPAQRAADRCASATRWRRRRRSASSSAGSPISSTPSSGAGRRPRPGRGLPGRAAQSARRTGREPCARHPSQLYEAGLEGLALFLLLALRDPPRRARAAGPGDRAVPRRLRRWRGSSSSASARPTPSS